MAWNGSIIGNPSEAVYPASIIMYIHLFDYKLCVYFFVRK